MTSLPIFPTLLLSLFVSSLVVNFQKLLYSCRSSDYVTRRLTSGKAYRKRSLSQKLNTASCHPHQRISFRGKQSTDSLQRVPDRRLLPRHLVYHDYNDWVYGPRTTSSWSCSRARKLLIKVSFAPSHAFQNFFRKIWSKLFASGLDEYIVIIYPCLVFRRNVELELL